MTVRTAPSDADEIAPADDACVITEDNRHLYQLLAEFDSRFIRGQPKLSRELVERICAPLGAHLKI